MRCNYLPLLVYLRVQLCSVSSLDLCDTVVFLFPPSPSLSVSNELSLQSEPRTAESSFAFCCVAVIRQLLPPVELGSGEGLHTADMPLSTGPAVQ